MLQLSGTLTIQVTADASDTKSTSAQWSQLLSTINGETSEAQIQTQDDGSLVLTVSVNKNLPT